jgi:uncharacterized SAM-binding protein YcdF (DUF218 family)
MRGIIVLGASKERMKRRMGEAISLYFQDQENSILIFSGYSWPREYINIASKCGIFSKKIWRENGSRTTKENALYCKELVEGTEIEEIDVVTDSPHLARVKKIFNEQFKDYKRNFYAVPTGLKIFAYLPFEILSWIKLLFDKGDVLDKLVSSYRRKVEEMKTGMREPKITIQLGLKGPDAVVI